MSFFKEDISKEEELALAVGGSINVGGIRVYPLTIGEIGEIGLNKYDGMIASLLTSKDMITDMDEEKLNLITDYDVVMTNLNNNKEFKDSFLMGLETFLKEKVSWEGDKSIFIIGDLDLIANDLSNSNSYPIRFITSKNYEPVIRAIRLVNLLNKPEFPKKKKEVPLTPQQKRIQELKAKRDKGREQIKEAKNIKGALSLIDIYSIVSTYVLDFNKIKSWTLYQLYSAHNMFMKHSDYQERFDIFLAGGEAKKLKLDQHWSITK